MSGNLAVELAPELRNRIREIIADVLEVGPEEIREEHSFAEDFEADSLLVIEMFSRFERQLHIEIPQEELVDLDSLGTAYALIARHVTEPTGV
ncbi:acyl carrier protein (plasmid) [Streptomyces goshikiensis]|uniref:Acyl carrier protein n=1 Tax=Streptomyces goshikiensis TaxID=1942 RepID=A0ABZ1RXF4_9ACTN|nr:MULTISPECIES: acyl carrier protein [Streptomyces]AYV32430.1 Acyl carrier protein [Streptomyces sp. ADI95-16]MBT1186264.1 acyl carrier protein [Streptomyces sp. CJ_13]